MKVAILKDTRGKTTLYFAYHYSWMFRLFGKNFATLLACGFDEEQAIERAKGEIEGKVFLTNIVEI